MKNTLLILVLGLFVFGCLDEGPFDPTAGYDGYLWGDDWTCPTNDYTFDTLSECWEGCPEHPAECFCNKDDGECD